MPQHGTQRGVIVCQTVASMSNRPDPTAVQRTCSVSTCAQPLWVASSTLERMATDLHGGDLLCVGCARMRLRHVQDQGRPVELVLPNGKARQEIEAHYPPGISLEAVGHLYARLAMGVDAERLTWEKP